MFILRSKIEEAESVENCYLIKSELEADIKTSIELLSNKISNVDDSTIKNAIKLQYLYKVTFKCSFISLPTIYFLI